METTIHLIRHGETDWNREKRYQGQKDIPLNNVGRLQAKKLVKRLQNENMQIDAIYSSNLIRAKETADIIAEYLNKPVHLQEKVKERYFGRLEGLKLEDFKAEFPHINMNNVDQYDFFHVEPFNVFKQRMVEGVIEVAKKHINETIVIVSHGAAINTFLFDISNGALGSGITKIVNASITTITFNHRFLSWDIKEINDISHIGA